MGPYKTTGKRIDFVGNLVFEPCKDVGNQTYSITELSDRASLFITQKIWGHISKINDRIYRSTVEFFSKKGAHFTLLPLTTRMISSPGAVYGKHKLNYTTDTSPITVEWFDLDRCVFLSESSQIYLELALLQNNVSEVYSIYNSFRKEQADPTHLSEFHHIEYEGHVTQEANQIIAHELIKKIITDLVNDNYDDLRIFISTTEITYLHEIVQNIKIITFKEALQTLYEDTGDEKYKEFTLKHFGEWEEIRLGELFKTLIGIREFPILEVPFYHSTIKDSEPMVANNMDIIWPGYREILGSGERIGTKKELYEKASIFNLPLEDYQPYLQSREYNMYQRSSGFGLGWERLIQAILSMPYIWSASQFPRVDKTIMP